MKLAKFIGKHTWKIAIIFAIIAAIVTSLVLYTDAKKNIDAQINELYAKDTLVQQDFSNVYNLNGITCYINTENNVIIFNAEDCSLKATYSKNGILLTKELEDLRVGSAISSFICVVVLTFICVFLISTLILILLASILEDINEKINKSDKKKKQNNKAD